MFTCTKLNTRIAMATEVSFELCLCFHLSYTQTYTQTHTTTYTTTHTHSHLHIVTHTYIHMYLWKIIIWYLPLITSIFFSISFCDNRVYYTLSVEFVHAYQTCSLTGINHWQKQITSAIMLFKYLSFMGFSKEIVLQVL